MKRIKKHILKNTLLTLVGVGFLCTGLGIAWVSTLKLPDFKSFTERKIASSTKIYDRTGTILLYDVHQDIKRTIIPYEEMGVNIKNATVAIEDSEFYQHKGIRITSIIRGTIWAKLTGKKVTGGSTITQQLIKNTLLTGTRTLTRKVKEWILAIKLEQVMSKEDILALYLNEAPYGGNIYGIEEASKAFFGKEPRDLTLAESAYLAAIPNGPTYYSPYGKNVPKLEERKNMVLKRMLDVKFITQVEYDQAKSEKVFFLPAQPMHIAAPHFVFFIKQYLENKYGTDVVDEGGLKVITTLDYPLQKSAEDIALSHAKENEKSWNGKNASVVVIDPKTGQILTMVGSRDYFDKTVDGNFNVATALRQPGSSFKPIVYAEAFKKGYTEDTTLFDVKTEFSNACDVNSNPIGNHKKTDCYHPGNFDDSFRGPMTLKNALAQSINIIAVKMLYLVGIPDALKMAHDLGITTLNDPSRYGLSLVIGGGEVTLLDMTSVYSVFAADGVRHPYQAILSVTDASGDTLEQYQDKHYQVLDPNVTDTLSDILSDNTARTPTYGVNSALVIPGVEAAVKTGTTNDNKDAWTIGYTPSVTVGVWVGNNDNILMKKGGVALAGPIWNAVMTEALKNLPRDELFKKPEPVNTSIPPVLRGFWQGGDTFVTDKVSGQIATEYTPKEMREEKSITNVHTILYWINKDDPLGSRPTNPEKDSQYNNWEYGVQNWWAANRYKYKTIRESDKPIGYDQTHTQSSQLVFQVNGITEGMVYERNTPLSININTVNPTQIQKIDVYVNSTYITSLKTAPFSTSITLNGISDIGTENTLRIIGYDIFGNSGQQSIRFSVSNN